MGVAAVRRGAPPSLPKTVPLLITWLLLLLLHAHICGAVSPARTNSSSSEYCCDGGDPGEWLLGEDEFPMGSETNRRFLSSFNPYTGGSKIAQKPANSCGQGKGYRTCLPRGNGGGKPKPKCATYTRDCR